MKEKIRVNDWDGFCESVTTILVDKEDLKNTYTNEYGVEFLKHDGNLYMCDDRFCLNFERIRNENQIERAFNPDRVAFNEWRRK